MLKMRPVNAEAERAVIDTCVVLSAMGVHGVHRQAESLHAVDYVLAHMRGVMSWATRQELVFTGLSPEFSPRAAFEPLTFLRDFIRQQEMVTPTQKFNACRDSADNKFVEAAIAGRARWLISEDDDLLSLRQVGSVHIVTPKQFLSAQPRDLRRALRAPAEP